MNGRLKQICGSFLLGKNLHSRCLAYQYAHSIWGMMPIYMRPMNKSVILYLDTFADQTFSQIVAWCPKRMAKNLHQSFFLGVCWRNQQVQLFQMKFIDVQCFLLFLNKYSLWQSSTSVWKCFAHIRICVSIYTYICILCFFGICHGEAIHGCSEMGLPVPWRIPVCTHETTSKNMPALVLLEVFERLPWHHLQLLYWWFRKGSDFCPSRCWTPMDGCSVHIQNLSFANNKRPSKNTLQPVYLTPWRIGFWCHGSFCRRFHVDLGVPEVCMWSFPESCLAWHRWSRRLQLDIRGILVPFRWEASVFCCEESALLRERYSILRLWERFFFGALMFEGNSSTWFVKSSVPRRVTSLFSSVACIDGSMGSCHEMIAPDHELNKFTF